MSIQNFLKNIKEKQFRSCYHFYGEEKFLVKFCIDKIRENYFAAEPHVLFFNDKNFKELPFYHELKHLDFFSPKKLIIIDRFEKIKIQDLEKFKRELAALHETLIIFVSEKYDSRLKINKVLTEISESVEFKKVDSEGLRTWIRFFFRQNHKPEVADSLVMELSSLLPLDLWSVQNEILKIINFLGDTPFHSVGQIKELLNDHHQESVFNLVDYVGEKKHSYALAVLNDLLDEGEAELKILSLLHRQFSLLYRVKQSSQRGLREMSKDLKLPPFVVEKLMRVSKLYPLAKLSSILQTIPKMDYLMKTNSSIPKEHLLVKFVIGI